MTKEMWFILFGFVGMSATLALFGRWLTKNVVRDQTDGEFKELREEHDKALKELNTSIAALTTTIAVSNVNHQHLANELHRFGDEVGEVRKEVRTVLERVARIEERDKDRRTTTRRAADQGEAL